tara:strand:+ start:550 stop:837 length:288 start_codon:yes stop_codon:yes gene_type:complete
MKNYDAWLEKPYQDQVAQDELIEQEAWKLLRTNKMLTSVSSLCEAISEDILYTKKDALEEAMENLDFKRFGEIIYHLNLDFWEDFCIKQIIKDLE